MPERKNQFEGGQTPDEELVRSPEGWDSIEEPRVYDGPLPQGELLEDSETNRRSISDLQELSVGGKSFGVPSYGEEEVNEGQVSTEELDEALDLLPKGDSGSLQKVTDIINR